MGLYINFIVIVLSLHFLICLKGYSFAVNLLYKSIAQSHGSWMVGQLSHELKSWNVQFLWRGGGGPIEISNHVMYKSVCFVVVCVCECACACALSVP